MEAFNIYINAFKHIKNYHNPASRKEFNFFILFYFIFWLIIFIPCLIASPFFIINVERFFVYLTFSMAVGWLIYLVHALPLLALIKRRLIDVLPQKANRIFWIYLTLELIRIIVTAIYPFVIFSFKDIILAGNGFPVSKFIIVWVFGLINNFFSIIVLCFYIFLMVKQGNIGKENN